MSIILQVMDGKGHTRWFESADEFLLGRDPSKVKLVVDDDLVSRVHGGFVRRRNGDWVYIHRGRNKSRVDGQRMTRLSDQVKLKDGSIIQVGSTQISVRFDDDVPTTVMGTCDIQLQDPDEAEELFELDNPEPAEEDASDDSVEGRTMLDTDWRAEAAGQELTAVEVNAELPSGHPARREPFALHGNAGNSTPSAVLSSSESTTSATAAAHREVEEVDVSPPTLPPEARVGGFWASLWKRFLSWFSRR